MLCEKDSEGEHAVEACKVDARRGHQDRKRGDDQSAGWPIGTAAGSPEGVGFRDARHRIQRFEEDAGAAVAPGGLEPASR